MDYVPKELNKESTKQLETSMKTIQSGELESINITTPWDKEEDKYKENSSANDIKGKENTMSMSENQEKARDGSVHMYEYDKSENTIS